jgi:hypothetical protein
LIGSSAAAQDWALDMFHHHTDVNFGTVARGAKVEHRFTVENIYKEDAHIASVASSCNCTKPSLTKTYLRTWDKAEVVCTIDTKSFLGHREAAVKVKFDQPFEAEVILHVSVFIRGDVVVQPGEIDFGAVRQGAHATRQVAISYAGLANWEISAIETSNRYLDIHAVESGRSAGQVTYDLTVSLKESMPAGYLKDQLILVTNDTDAYSSRVPVAIEGVILPSISVRPSPLLMGVATTGQLVTKTLVVQSHAPFRVVNVWCSDPRFKFRKPDAPQSLQLIPVIFAAGDAPGAVEQIIHIQTDGKAAMDVPVQVRVVPNLTVNDEAAGPSHGSLATPAPAATRATPPQVLSAPAVSKPMVGIVEPPSPAVTTPVVPSPGAKTPAPPVEIPAVEKKSPSSPSRAAANDSNGPALLAPGQAITTPSPGLQMPLSQLLATPDGSPTSAAAKDPATAEIPPSPLPSAIVTPVTPPAAAVTPPAVSKPSTTAVKVPPAARKAASSSPPLQHPSSGPRGKLAPQRTADPHGAIPSNGSTPGRPSLPWEAPPAAKPQLKADPPQN